MIAGGIKKLTGAVLISGLLFSAQAQVTVSLGGLGGSPDYRWRDTPGNLYAESYRSSFDYGSGPAVALTYEPAAARSGAGVGQYRLHHVRLRDNR